MGGAARDQWALSGALGAPKEALMIWSYCHMVISAMYYAAKEPGLGVEEGEGLSRSLEARSSELFRSKDVRFSEAHSGTIAAGNAW